MFVFCCLCFVFVFCGLIRDIVPWFVCFLVLMVFVLSVYGCLATDHEVVFSSDHSNTVLLLLVYCYYSCF